MNKEQMKNVLNKVQELEKILMRDLTDEETKYLESHSSKDFLFDILGYTEKDLKSLQSIKDILSEYCTTPLGKEFDEVDDALSIFDSDGEFSPYPITKSLFNEEDPKHNDVIEQALQLVKKFQEEQKKPKIKIKEAEKTDGKGFEFPQDTEEPYNTIDPKWLVYLGNPEQIIQIASSVLKDFMKDSSPELKEESSNMLYGEIVDKIKDAVVGQEVESLEHFKEISISDEEIRSEVLDYLYKNKYKVVQQDDKIRIL